MNFYIKKIQLWFNENLKPICYEFKPNKVNVIRGDSSTGKSSLLCIIDYCLLSTKSTIVEDVINENIKWYGLVFNMNGNNYTIIRKSPKLESPEMDVIWKENEFLPEYPVPTGDNIANVTIKMNKLFNVPNTKLTTGNNNIKLSFRHCLLFNYLTENIIATANTYLDTKFFRDRDYDLIIDELFNLLVNVDELKIKSLSDKVLKEQKKLSSYQKKLEKQNIKNNDYANKLQNIVQRCVNLNLIKQNENAGNLDEVVKRLEQSVKEYTIFFKNKSNNIKTEELQKEINNISQTLGYYNRLYNEYKQYMKQLKEEEDSLIPISYLKQHMSEIVAYEETGILINRLEKAWNTIKKSYTPEVKLPIDFDNRCATLKEKLATKQKELDKLNPYKDKIYDYQWMNATVELIHDIQELTMPKNNSNVEEKTIYIKSDIDALNDALSKLEAKNDTNLSNLNTFIKEFFDLQNSVSNSYKNCTPIYSIKEQAILLEKPGRIYPIANIGSKSNYMFLHLCFFFGLHELLIKSNTTLVPNFLFIDQPSIPYYADKSENKDEQTLNDDQQKLIDAFKLINSFMVKMNTNYNHQFQIILVEHASEIYWKNKLGYFETRYNFTRNNGLIPNYIYKVK